MQQSDSGCSQPRFPGGPTNDSVTLIEGPGLGRWTIDERGEQAWRAVLRMLRSLEAVREGGAWYLLMATFAGAGMLMAMSESALARAQLYWAIAQAAAALFVAFYGSNAAGALMMARACGREIPDLASLVRQSLGRSHRLLVVLMVLVLSVGLLAAGLFAALWLCRLPWVGPLLYAVVVPAGVVLCGATALASAAVVTPLAAPAVWSGAGVVECLRMLAAVVRRRLVLSVMLTVALSLLVGLVGAMLSFAVLAGGRVVGEASVLLGLKVPVDLLMASLMGVGVRGLALAGVADVTQPHAMAAAVGGGVVFAMALVLPALVYLRGICEMHLALKDSLSRRD